MENTKINRINFKNIEKNLDFEIVDIFSFFATRSHLPLTKDYRVNFWSVMYIIEGSGTHYIDFKPYEYKAGDIIFINKNQVHHYVINHEVKGYIMHINEPFFYRLNGLNGDAFLEFTDQAFGSPVLSFDVSCETTNRSLIELIHKEYNHESKVNIELIATLFQGFILSLKDLKPTQEKVLLSKDYVHFKLYRQLVEKHYTETRNVEDYADMMHLSKKTVNQATRKVVGLSAKEFIINRVILEIKRFLSQGELLNYEIADVLGFEEAANMTKFFKRYEGLSPKVFKEQNNMS